MQEEYIENVIDLNEARRMGLITVDDEDSPPEPDVSEGKEEGGGESV